MPKPPNMPTLFSCGCSWQKVQFDRCDVFDRDGNERTASKLSKPEKLDQGTLLHAALGRAEGIVRMCRLLLKKRLILPHLKSLDRIDCDLERSRVWMERIVEDLCMGSTAREVTAEEMTAAVDPLYVEAAKLFSYSSRCLVLEREEGDPICSIPFELFEKIVAFGRQRGIAQTAYQTPDVAMNHCLTCSGTGREPSPHCEPCTDCGGTGKE